MGDRTTALERAAARHLVTKCLRVQPGENVVVEAWTHTLSMSSAVVDEVRRAGGRALLAYESDDAWWRALERGQGKLLGTLSDPEWAAIEAADAYVQFWGPGDSARLAALPDQKLDDWGDGWFDRWYKLGRSTGLRGARMATGWVTESRALHWGLRRGPWMDRLLRSCRADPTELARSGRRLARAFRGERRVRITHPNGTDVEVALAGVPPRVYDGSPHPRMSNYSEYDLMANFPDGRLVIALDSATAVGRIVASRPSYDEVWFPWSTYTGGMFEFTGGRLTAFSFAKGGAEFGRRFARATTGKDRTGSLRIGLNPHVRALPYLEDMERGCVRLAVGGNAYLGGSNTSDFRGWITLAGAEISVGGRPVVRDGMVL